MFDGWWCSYPDVSSEQFCFCLNLLYIQLRTCSAWSSFDVSSTTLAAGARSQLLLPIQLPTVSWAREKPHTLGPGIFSTSFSHYLRLLCSHRIYLIFDALTSGCDPAVREGKDKSPSGTKVRSKVQLLWLIFFQKIQADFFWVWWTVPILGIWRHLLSLILSTSFGIWQLWGLKAALM